MARLKSLADAVLWMKSGVAYGSLLDESRSKEAIPIFERALLKERGWSRLDLVGTGERWSPPQSIAEKYAEMIRRRGDDTFTREQALVLTLPLTTGPALTAGPARGSKSRSPRRARAPRRA